jgi:putative membrane protein
MALLDPNSRKTINIIKIVSIALPVVVAILFGIKIPGVDTSFLPSVYATINGFTAILLLGALIAIKKKDMRLHRALIRFSLFLSIIFLGLYVVYHMTSDSTAYEGAYGMIYYPILVSHIILSVIVIPIVLFTYLWAWQGKYAKHKKWTRFAWPMWFYVAVTGVVVYWMISPFY